jgi:hypothetical protein
MSLESSRSHLCEKALIVLKLEHSWNEPRLHTKDCEEKWTQELACIPMVRTKEKAGSGVYCILPEIPFTSFLPSSTHTRFEEQRQN